MSITALTCPRCGASLKAGAFQRQVRCEYCNTMVTVQTESAEAPSRLSLLERAFIFLKDGNFTRADEYFERVLDIEPKTAMAYAGKLAAALRVRSIFDLRWSAKYLDSYQLFKKAKEYATAEELEELMEIEAAVKRRIDGTLAKQKAQIDEIDKRIAAKQSELECMHAICEKSEKKITLYKVLKIFAIVFVAVSVVMTIGAFTAESAAGLINLFIICLPAVAWMIFNMVMQLRWTKVLEGYTNIQEELEKLTDERTDKVAEYIMLKRNMR